MEEEVRIAEELRLNSEEEYQEHLKAEDEAFNAEEKNMKAREED